MSNFLQSTNGATALAERALPVAQPANLDSQPLPATSEGRRLIFVNRYFHPDHSATSQMLSDLAFALASDGENVAVIASRQLYQRADARLSARERVHDVEVYRAGTTRFGRAGIIGRAVDYCSFHVTAAITLMRVARRDDIVVAMTDPPLMSVTAAIVAQFKRFCLVNWLQDLYPEVAVHSGIALSDGWLGRGLRWARNRSLGAAAANVAIGEQMALRLERESIPSGRIATITNWTDDLGITPAGRDNPLREDWGLEDKFVVGYSGNLGTAHEATAILEAAERLKNRTDICFLIIGGGSRLSDLQREVRAKNLSNFVFKPYQPRQLLPMTLTLPDLHWLSLRSEFEGLIVPSKFYGIAAAGRPMILIGAETGELAKLIRTRTCGYAVAPSESERLAKLIADLADAPMMRAEMGKNARRLIEAEYSMAASIGKWRALLSHLAFAARQRPKPAF